MLRRLRTEKDKMGKTEVYWKGRRVAIDEVIVILEGLVKKEERGKVLVQARVSPAEPSPTKLTEFSEVKIEYF